MRIEIIYYADDDTEFSTKEECLDYEAKKQADFESILFFDDSFGHLDELSLNTFECVWYMKILDGEKASRLLQWQYDYYGVCMDGLPKELHAGEIYAWDNDSGEWYDPKAKMKKYTDIVDAIEKAVAKL